MLQCNMNSATSAGMRRLAWVTVVLCACGQLEGPSVESRRDGLDAVTSFGTNPGALKMYRYVPASLEVGRPVVVVLHGCADTAAGFSTSWSGWSQLADARRFSLVFPEQQASNNVSTCFNWFEPGDQLRDQGEAGSVKQMVERTLTDTSGAPRWYVVGFSAGAAAAVNLLAAYPDQIVAGAVAAGVPYKCAESVTAAFDCMSGGGGQTPATWATRARLADPGFSGAWPRVAVWQGLADGTVAPSNRTELVEQWTALHGVDQTADGTSAISTGGTRSAFKNGAGETVVELDEVPGLAHNVRPGWPTDMADFFGLAAPANAGGAGGGSGTAGGNTAGGGVAGGSAAGGSMGTAGGASSAAGGSASAGSGGTPSQPSSGCQSAPGAALLATLVLLTSRGKRRSLRSSGCARGPARSAGTRTSR